MQSGRRGRVPPAPAGALVWLPGAIALCLNMVQTHPDCGIVNSMKALKSTLAIELLADPSARDQLRRFLITQNRVRVNSAHPEQPPFEIRRSSGDAVKATVVPKAKAA